MMFGLEMYPSIYEKAATYLYHIVRNHPFNDANKRTGHVATLIFLKGNDVQPLFKNDHLENFVVEVAKGEVSKEKLTHFLEHGTEISYV
jgi:death on curing protein